MAKMIRVHVSRSFNTYTAGDEFLVSEDDTDAQVLIAAKLFEVLAVEDAPKEKPKAKSKPAKKPVGKKAKG